MDYTFIAALLKSIIGGGDQSVMCLLIVMLVAVIWDRQRLIKVIERKDERIEKIIQEYYSGNLTMTEALNSLKVVLAEIKGKL